MKIDKTFPSAQPEVLTFVETTPEDLREIANRLEEAEKDAQKGKVVTVRLTQGIALTYQAEKFKNFR